MAVKIDGDAIAEFFFAMEVALEFDVDVVVAEDPDEAIDHFAGFVRATLFQSRRQRAFDTAGEAD